MKNFTLVFRIAIICLYLLTLFIMVKNLNYQYLWFDESGQFWISKGLNHNSQPLSKENGLIDVIENNKHYNLDPGGFSILLHFWSKISNHHVWLRILPFLFLAGIIASFIYLSYKWLNNINIAIIMGFIPILHPMILNQGFEIRAFSMEALGAVLCVISIEQLSKKVNYLNLLMWGCILSIFITSRYSLIIVAFLTSVLVLFFIFRTNNSTVKKILLTLSYSLPLIFTLGYIYYFALIFQNPDIKPLFYLTYLSSNPLFLLSKLNLLYLSGLAFFTILLIASFYFQLLTKYRTLLYVAVIANIFFLVLSFLGKYPWDPISSRNISMVILMLLCFSALLGEVISYLFFNKRATKYYLVSVLLLSFLVYLIAQFSIQRNDRRSYNTYMSFMQVDVKYFDKIYVDSWEASYVKYLFEYGELKREVGNSYPSKFTFEKGIPHGLIEGNLTRQDWAMKRPKMNELTEYSLLITPDLYQLGQNDKWVLLNNFTNFWVRRDDYNKNP